MREKEFGDLASLLESEWDVLKVELSDDFFAAFAAIIRASPGSGPAETGDEIVALLKRYSVGRELLELLENVRIPSAPGASLDERKPVASIQNRLEKLAAEARQEVYKTGSNIEAARDEEEEDK